jgi:hypothetical protein
VARPIEQDAAGLIDRARRFEGRLGDPHELMVLGASLAFELSLAPADRASPAAAGDRHQEAQREHSERRRKNGSPRARACFAGVW